MDGVGVIIAPSAGSAARLLMQINMHIGWAQARRRTTKQYAT
jgi:hypothetical protein